jgi:hypothetical protein
MAKHADWKEVTPRFYRAETRNGTLLWLTPQGGFIVNAAGQTVWERETVNSSEQVEEEAIRLGLFSPNEV